MSAQVTYVDWLENYAAHPYKMTTIKRYVAMLETAPEKLNISLSKSIMEIADPDEFENAFLVVTSHEEYDQLNKSCNGALSAALAAYRKYLAFVDKTSIVGGAEKVYTPEWFRILDRIKAITPNIERKSTTPFSYKSEYVGKLEICNLLWIRFVLTGIAWHM